MATRVPIELYCAIYQFSKSTAKQAQFETFKNFIDFPILKRRASGPWKACYRSWRENDKRHFSLNRSPCSESIWNEDACIVWSCLQAAATRITSCRREMLHEAQESKSWVNNAHVQYLYYRPSYNNNRNRLHNGVPIGADSDACHFKCNLNII